MSEVKYKLNGKAVTREEFHERVKPKEDWLDGPPMTANTYTEHDPLVSQASGVMKSEVENGRELIRKHGIQGAAVRDDGSVQFTSKRARKEWLHHRGQFDLDGGYSD